MKVKELIEKLSRCDGDAEVFYLNDEYDTIRLRSGVQIGRILRDDFHNRTDASKTFQVEDLRAARMAILIDAREDDL